MSSGCHSIVAELITKSCANRKTSNNMAGMNPHGCLVGPQSPPKKEDAWGAVMIPYLRPSEPFWVWVENPESQAGAAPPAHSADDLLL